jgi:hypothetical protein
MVFYTTQWMQRHTHIPHLENENQAFYSGDQVVGRQKPATPPEVLLRYLWQSCSMSCLICMISGACRLNFLMIAVACSPVIPRLWSDFLVWLLDFACCSYQDGVKGFAVSE